MRSLARTDRSSVDTTNLLILEARASSGPAFPNGIALSPDEKHLYVTAGFRKTLRYDVLPDDTVTNPKPFLNAGNDGIKVDRNGNVYSTVQGNEIWISSPEGKHLGTLQLPQITREPRPRIVATNMAFGDADSKTSARGHLPYAGLSWPLLTTKSSLKTWRVPSPPYYGVDGWSFISSEPITSNARPGLQAACCCPSVRASLGVEPWLLLAPLTAPPRWAALKMF